MSKIRRRNRKRLSSSSSIEGPTTVQDEEDETSASQTFSTIMASEERSSNESPSLADVWKVLTEIKTNTEKLVLEVNSLKVNYKEFRKI